MLSGTTIYRVCVMIAVAVIATQCWQLYGPAPRELELVLRRGREIAQTAWDRWQPRADNAASEVVAAEPGFPPMEPPDFEPPATAWAMPPLAKSAPYAAPALSTTSGQSTQEPAVVQAVMEAGPPASPPDRMAALMARLEQLGVRDSQLVPWGSSGQVYRFCCRAAWADDPSFTRHFESVASEPLAAVEDVVTKVQSWRSEREAIEDR